VNKKRAKFVNLDYSRTEVASDARPDPHIAIKLISLEINDGVGSFY